MKSRTQWKLPALLLLVVPAAANSAEPSQGQDAAVAAIRKLRGRVTFRNNKVLKVGFRNEKITDADLLHLKRLTSVVTVGVFNSTKMTGAGLMHLKGLDNLKSLYLPGTSITDTGLKHLKEMTQLVNLYLQKTKVTDTGLEHLKGLTKLRILYLSGTEVTDAGVKKLQQALPNCRIIRGSEWTIYDKDPQHLWNRVHRTLFARRLHDREVGADELDPLIWRGSKYLTREPRLSRIVDVLTEFIDENGEGLIRDPQQRAVLQHDVWSVFDWIHNVHRKRIEADAKLEQLIVQVMRRVALQPQELAELKSNYQAAIASGKFPRQPDPGGAARYYFPSHLLSPGSDWICVGEKDKNVVALIHVHVLDGRSIFTVHLNLPGGRDAGLRYLAKLRDFPDPVRESVNVRHPYRTFRLNPKIPQFPVGTQLALVRRMLHITADGQLAVTPLVESIQLRHHREIPEEPLDGFWGGNLEQTEQQFFEFVINRRQLFSGQAGGLRPTINETPFRLFNRTHHHRGDPIERGYLKLASNRDEGEDSAHISQLRGCFACHGHSGIFAMNSYLRRSHSPFRAIILREPPRQLKEIGIERVEQRTIRWKMARDTWLILKRHWRW